jgi:hypothetical protein
MRKIIMVKKKEKIFKTSLLKCIKLQDSNTFSIKLNYFILKNIKMCTSWINLLD